MRSLLRYVLKNYAFLLFLLLEVVSFVLIFNYNTYQKSKYLNTSNRVVASVYSSFNSIVSYFGLKEVNQKLSDENAALKSFISDLPYLKVLPDSVLFSTEKKDSVYRYISAMVINNSVNKQLHYFK